MTPEQMAQIHAAAFTDARSWTAAEFNILSAQPFVTVFTAKGGLALTRTLAGESELLTLAVHPDHQRRGVARGLIADWIAAVQSHAETAFLEVAEDNDPALALYLSEGFAKTGLRKGYYARRDGPAINAVLMSRGLPQG